MDNIKENFQYNLNMDFIDFSLSKSGVMTTRFWGAYFKLKNDIRSIFPYINASLTDARFHDRPEYIQFNFNDIKCSLYPKELIAASFLNKQAALDFFKQLMDYIDDLYRKRYFIQPDYRRYRPPSVIDILKLLPKTNCKKCGYATCMAFASALRNGETKPDYCMEFAAPINISKVYPVFDDKGDLASTITIDFDVPEESSPAFPAHHIEQTDYETNGIPDTGDAIIDENGIKNDTGNNSTIADFFDTDEKTGIPPLSLREIQVLKYITNGYTNPEIAKILGISPHTVKSHVVHIFNKIGVNDRTQAAVWATRYNIMDEN